MRFAIAVALAGLACASVASATVRHVPSQYITIQSALDACTPGDEVLVASGVYQENLTMKSGVVLTSESGPELTVIDGGCGNSVITCTDAASTTCISGFTIRNGFHGIYISGGAPRIENNIVTQNAATSDDGGGVYCINCTAVIDRNTLVDNSCGVSGGGIFIYLNSSVLVTGNLIKANSAGVGGGILVATGATANLSGNLFLNNRAGSWGGAIGLTGGGSATIQSNTLYGNQGTQGAGIGLVSSAATVIKNIIACHTGAAFECASSSVVSSCNNLWSNEYNYEGCSFDTTTNLAVDPLFCNVLSLDFRLVDGSLCNEHPVCGRIGAYGIGCGLSEPVRPEIVSVYPKYLGLGQQSTVVFCFVDSTGTKTWDRGAPASVSSSPRLGTCLPVRQLSDTTYTFTYEAGFACGTDSIYVYDPECKEEQYAWATIDIVPAPEIVAVADVPGDQGGKVIVQWNRSAIDTYPDTSVTHYSIWRSLRLPSGTAPASLPLVTAQDVEPDFAGPGYRFTVSGGATYYWEWIGNVPAHRFEGYSFNAPTLADSTSLSPAWHYFLVSAQTQHEFAFRDSKPDSGYSVDNLAPSSPSQVSGRHVESVGLLLSWSPNSEQDLSHYAIYKGLDSTFVPSEVTLLGTATDTSFVDRSYNLAAASYYKLTALDVHENESRWTMLAETGGPTVIFSPELAAGVKGSGIEITWSALPGATGYNLYERKEMEEGYVRITETSILPGLPKYVYELSEYPEVTTYIMLSVLVPGGIEVRYGPVVVYPLRTAIVRCSPNPFSQSTQVQYSVASDLVGSLRVYDVAGRLVRTLHVGMLARGTRSIVWDGSTDAGARAAAGVYVVRFETGGLVESRKLVLTRE